MKFEFFHNIYILKASVMSFFGFLGSQPNTGSNASSTADASVELKTVKPPVAEPVVPSNPVPDMPVSDINSSAAGWTNVEPSDVPAAASIPASSASTPAAATSTTSSSTSSTSSSTSTPASSTSSTSFQAGSISELVTKLESAFGPILDEIERMSSQSSSAAASSSSTSSSSSSARPESYSAWARSFAVPSAAPSAPTFAPSSSTSASTSTEPSVTYSVLMSMLPGSLSTGSISTLAPASVGGASNVNFIPLMNKSVSAKNVKPPAGMSSAFHSVTRCTISTNAEADLSLAMSEWVDDRAIRNFVTAGAAAETLPPAARVRIYAGTYFRNKETNQTVLGRVFIRAFRLWLESTYDVDVTWKRVIVFDSDDLGYTVCY